MSPVELTWRLARQKAIDAENALSVASGFGEWIQPHHLEKFRAARDAARLECKEAFAAFLPEGAEYYQEAHP